jgi:hypothetical protein
MSFLNFFFPRYIFYITVHQEFTETKKYFLTHLIGRKAHVVDTIIGNRGLNYEGIVEYDEIQLTRCVETISRVPIYPTATLKFHSEQDATKIIISLSNSSIWRFFIVCFYLLFLLLFIWKSLQVNNFQEGLFLSLKFFSGILILSGLQWYYHYTELNNVKGILGQIATLQEK